MSSSTHRWLTIAALAAAASMFALPGCTAASSGSDESEELTSAPEDVATTEGAISGALKVGSTLIATANVNLRTGPSTSHTILHVVPEGSSVTVVESTPQNGFYKIKHNGTTGWSYGAYYKAGPSGSSGGTSGKRAEAIARAKSGVGFSYWWGHGRFRPEGPTASNKGSCSGSCPSCSHSGSYGGDCSGYVGKIWQVGSGNTDLTVDAHPYSTASFVKDTSLWSTVSRNNLEVADAMVYNSGSEGHIFLYESGDAWGSVHAYECKGCSYGCVYNSRTVSSAYHGIRRSGY